jgi:hypothetical protein
MKTIQPNHLLKITLLVLCGSAVFVASSSWATLVTWDLNPTNANASLGASSQTFTVGGFPITAYGFDLSGSTPHTLYYKDANGDHGLGLVGTPHNEIQTTNFIQFDFTSILSQGFINGQMKFSSVDQGESFNLYGSNTVGTLGVLLTGSPFGDSTNNTFINIPNFGTYKFVSVIANVADILPWAFQADFTPIPEAGTLIPVILLAAAAMAFEARRRRHATA